MVVHRLHKRSFAVQAVVAGTDSWDWALHKVAEPALVDNLAVDADSDADSCSVDKVDQAIEDNQDFQDLCMEQAAVENYLELDLTPAADNSDLAEMLAVLVFRKLAEAVERMEMEPTLRLEALALVDLETLLEIADLIDCC